MFIPMEISKMKDVRIILLISIILLIISLIALLFINIHNNHRHQMVIKGLLAEKEVVKEVPQNERKSECGVTITGDSIGYNNVIEIENTNQFTVIIRMVSQGKGSEQGEETQFVKMIKPNEIFKTKTDDILNRFYICRESDGALIGFIK